MSLILRLCNEKDIDIVYKMANDSTVRENAFSGDAIPYDDHCRWYADSLANVDRIMYIAEERNVIVGQIRLDKQNNKAIISYSVEKNNRKKGYGKQILRSIKREAMLNGIVMLEGLVKKRNVASRKAFVHNGFIESEEENYFRYIYLLKSGDNIEIDKNSK
ncbi:GNAT family N-acetyltransferase [Clostridium beijerinckii]|uniref:GNAT family N-acetyltransferase n=1 Tax=Clostridium beijerinckii TaxID=1520 RepID=A0AAW3W740_CLOBE|nr:GNAT family N-acetyltransferase [Clostridium beijerinckii]MBC2455900.1 GNAT family N-acetyltransferase [Clostridium beijerinckii]MBC2474705.1 GNAT family N-acetyltransferase [Clostridium beijerinckii]MDG5852877.1 GNAT family N-acetyltransferase [Clostridium beijerinckii]NOV61855.1 RimJ/RimL family protein N-acetyltransferase [Clostridium beijerinckii]NOV68649.1 RimJ/RimL family protein N-acetyltransferase [Clostridium beijerinckii]